MNRRLLIVRGLAVPLVVAGLITAGAPGLYRIEQGDTLGAIAAEHGTTVRRLVALNNLPGNGNLIYAGELLRLPGRPTARPRPGRATPVSYTVRPGDTISEIARRFKIRQRALLQANGLTATDHIYAGSPLRIPLGTDPVPPPVRKKKRNNTFAGRTYPDKVVDAADRNRAILSKRRLPSKASIRRMIVNTSRRYGVDPYLALAVSWQESGWKQRAVSPANAIGAMQVIPSTGRFTSRIVGRDLNLLDARDNITAGVVLLQRLTAAAALPDAIAGYYQGLGSVRRRGMYTDTKRYVRNVLLIKQRLERAG
jgi:N-acetylmuramoyl-L-alanine amidase